jgi:succinate dehydrogenase/fumarate reductase flavoprotein subunit
MAGRTEILSGELDWGLEADVVVVGASVAGFTVAVHAAELGASTVMLEKADAVGGTGRKAAAWMWVPNNRFMQEKGLRDSREDALRYLARMARPALYEEGHPTLGLAAWEYELFEAFYDNADTALRSLEELGALALVHAEEIPNYYSHHPIDRVPRGRVVLPRLPNGEPGDGAEFIRQMHEAAVRRDVQIHTEHAVEGVFQNEDGAVVGVRARTPNGDVRVRARRGVVFCSGGFSHNDELRRYYLGGLLLGGCAARTNEGELVEISRRLGVPLLHMNAAYMTPVLLEKALARDPELSGVFLVSGDSLIIVNKHGDRVGNEKTTYNDRTLPHLLFDVRRSEYGNYLLFPVWDQRSADLFPGTAYGAFIPEATDDWAYVVQGDTLEELAAALDSRLESLGAGARGTRLGDDFAPALRRSIKRFNEFARAGKDEDFGRGDAPIELFFHGDASRNPYPNGLMHPIAETGPYYATILAPAAIETKGGPRANASGQILGADDEPVPGLYGVGNCVASPSGQAYLAGGATFGPYITFGYLAAGSVVAEPVKRIGARALA